MLNDSQTTATVHEKSRLGTTHLLHLEHTLSFESIWRPGREKWTIEQEVFRKMEKVRRRGDHDRNLSLSRVSFCMTSGREGTASRISSPSEATDCWLHHIKNRIWKEISPYCKWGKWCTGALFSVRRSPVWNRRELKKRRVSELEHEKEGRRRKSVEREFNFIWIQAEPRVLNSEWPARFSYNSPSDFHSLFPLWVHNTVSPVSVCRQVSRLSVLTSYCYTSSILHVATCVSLEPVFPDSIITRFNTFFASRRQVCVRTPAWWSCARVSCVFTVTRTGEYHTTDCFWKRLLLFKERVIRRKIHIRISFWAAAVPRRRVSPPNSRERSCSFLISSFFDDHH